ncbi:MAG: response regulator, partial [Deltaproteobacteria bacterium]|nr:response regulator [Deltaproteobacteria bacterium]
MNGRILLVDDNEEFLDSTRDVLDDEGYEVVTATSGEEGIELAGAQTFDVILMDIKMPGMNGVESFIEMKRRNPGVKVIMVTAYSVEDLMRQALEKGAFQYVRKPVQPTKLLKLLEDVFETISLREKEQQAKEALRKRNKELEGINKRLNMIVTSAKRLASSSRLKGFGPLLEIGPLLLKEFTKNLSAEGGSLYICKEDSLFLVDSLGPRHAPSTIPFPLRKDSVFERIITTCEPIFMENINEESDIIPSGWDGYKEGSLLVFPLLDENDKIFGIVSLHCKTEPPFTHQDRELGLILASYSCETIRASRALEALRKSEERFRIAAESASHLIYEWDIENGHLEWFGKIDEHLGYKPGELPRTIEALKDIIHLDDLDRVTASIEKHIKTLEPYHEEFRVFGKDGTVHYWWNRGKVILDEKSNASKWIGVQTDVTEQRRLRDLLQQSQKMEAIGTLAGGIAHDFNNLLMGIQGRTSLMLMDIDSSHPNYVHFKEIENIIKGGADLTKQLMGFARGGKYEVKPTDMNDLISKSSDMFGRTKKEISVYGKYEEDIWIVEVDKGQIEQVLLNLYVNAWQAMPGGGELYLRTENVTLDKSYVKPFNIKPGRYVKISVTDTGIGMDEATRHRIFEPFFTTKEMGRGTGLGLASAYGIIKNHEGVINIYSEQGKGTTFSIYLPASDKELIEEKELPGELLKGTETVLFVDDEEMIRDVGGALLRQMGYKVLSAGNGKEAVEVYSNNKDKIDMVILDMIMPEMGGDKAYDKMKEINPDIKVLLSSGYSVNGDATKIMKRGCDG